MDNKISRRSALKGSAGLSALAALSATGLMPRRTLAQGAFDWQRFKGQKIEVSLVKGPRADILQRFEKEFEQLTGIGVGSEQIPEQQHRQKSVIEFTSGRPSFDVVQISYHVQKRMFGKGMWLADLKGYLADPAMTPAEFDVADFAKPGMEYATQADGRIDSFPINADYWIVYWNKELFAAKGLAYPRTFDDMTEAAAKLTDQKAGIYGFTARGLKNANVPVWTSFLLGYDVDPVDQAGQLRTDGPQAIAAAEIYQKLLRDYAPPGSTGFNWNECQSSFVQGRAAMWLDGIGFAPPLEDPAKSRVVGKVGYGLMPAGPKAHHSAMFGDGIGIAAGSRKKGPAYFYCLWAAGKDMQMRLLQTGSGVPFRNSAIQNPASREGFKLPKDWFDVMIESAKISRPGLPVIVPVTEFRDVLGVALTNMIGGADPAAELKKATEQFKPILEKSEKA